MTTRGELKPAKITNLFTKTEVSFMFNPFEYTISKSNTWEDKAPSGRNVPLVTFGQGGAQSLTLALHFDTQLLKNVDVRQYTAPLWTMMMIDQSKKNPRSNKGEPPLVAFEWGKLYFKAVITNMSEKFTLFTDKGIPVRCQVQITLRQYEDTEDLKPQQGAQSAAAPTATTTQVREGDRLDHIAADTSGNPSDYRKIAESNNIDNPLRIPSGTSLKT